ncbi:MAG: putative DNA binding domain-containing protein, partial [Candidatus Wallbacteria bacterium]|nr:putative DNA binding domain-containing protein [Candidatus Wallbacteria bacterium]
MNLKAMMPMIALGEDSTRQFKADVRNGEALAAEIAAFANSGGGTLFIGVADDCSLPGLSLEDVGRVNQLISNACGNLVRSPVTVKTENVALKSGRLVIVLTVPEGLDRPYFDKNGVIWFKCGADKRRVNTKEELRRLFQETGQFYADEITTGVGIGRLDRLLFREYLRDFCEQDLPDDGNELLKMLQNMNLVAGDGNLNLACALMFAEWPERIKPQFVVKAVRYPGDDIHVSEYVDTEDITGSLRKVFDGSLAFIMRNLSKVQNGRGVNSPGVSEIPRGVF